MSNNHEEAMNVMEEERNAIEADFQNYIKQLEKESQVMQQQIENKDRYLSELKDSYNQLQEQHTK